MIPPAGLPRYRFGVPDTAVSVFDPWLGLSVGAVELASCACAATACWDAVTPGFGRGAPGEQAESPKTVVPTASKATTLAPRRVRLTLCTGRA